MKYIRHEMTSVGITMWRCYVAIILFVGVLALPENEEIVFNETVMDGIKMEKHRVVTDDLYILNVLRMQHEAMNESRHKHSVLLLHGMSLSSDSFIEHGSNLSLAYSLAEAGFDVWLGNIRGNKYSRQHVYLNPDDPVDKIKFFNYSYENIGLHDIPATVDYILRHTNTTQLHYIGHSQGGTAFLVLNSMRPEYSGKFKSGQLLAPAGYQKHFSNLGYIVLGKIGEILYKLLTASGIVEWNWDFTENREIDMCLGNHDYNALCEKLYEDGLMGTQEKGGGGAIKQQAHYGQNINNRQFRRWDFGTEMNLLVYRTPQPPNYNLSLITVPTLIYYGLGDILVDSKDVLDMALQMPEAELWMVSRPDFGHSDFVDAPDAPELVYQYIIDTLLFYEGIKMRVKTTPTPSERPIRYPIVIPINRTTCNDLNGSLLFIILMLKFI